MTAQLTIDREWFVDNKGRKVLLRGINLGGSSKIPMKPNGATHITTDFSDHRDVSFVGRPFPLTEAEEHFQRIRHWGFNCLRLVATWEAIEHAGPGLYDTEYLDYVDELVKIASSHGFYILIDPHQDCWSRMSGGDGAPGWTFEEVGIDFTKFNAVDAALIMQYRYDPNNPTAYPRMSWSQNRIRFASATMFTLFFGGADFAPSCKIRGESAQDFLQMHYAKSYRQVANRVSDCEYVLGFGTLNEPSEGWIELKVDGSNQDFSNALGYGFTPLDAMVTSSGYPRNIPYREVKRLGIRVTRTDTINEACVSVWQEECEDIWREAGVWDIDEIGNPIILQNDHFFSRNNADVDFCRDYESPFFATFAEQIRAEMPDAIIFYEAPPQRIFQGQSLNLTVPSNSVHKPHWYDFPTIGLNRFMGTVSFDYFTRRPVIGKKFIQKMFSRHLCILKNALRESQGLSPAVIGEFGLCYELENKKAFRTFKSNPKGAWKSHVKALSMYYNAIDANLLHSFQWNYTSDNNNKWGDLWNLEDFSIFSRDQQTNPDDLDSGGRALEGFCRPHFIHVAGTPIMMRFDSKKKAFWFEFDADYPSKAVTELYIPQVQYPEGYTVELSAGEYKSEHQLLLIQTRKPGIHCVKVNPISQ
ncbi:MAG: cellulase family glycosylhydrolase [Candidatus Hodarchaeota archaeon]